jgi:SAM-dependent methyltransferase
MADRRIDTPDHVRSLVHREWTDPATVAAWQRRHPDLDVQSRAATELVVAAADVAPGMRVLDLACGTGEPAASLAERVAPDGVVVALDVSALMLAAVAGRARAGELSRVLVLQADAERLPFADQTFDALTCRFGIMYFWDPELALREARRALRPGGRAAFIVWAAPELSSVFVNRHVAARYRDVPPVADDAPGRFRFCAPGSLAAALYRAGFTGVAEQLHHISWPTRGTPEQVAAGAPYWELIDTLPAARRDQAVAQVFAILRGRYDGQVVNHDAAVIVVRGTV